jgi:hypothetical protein
MSGLWRARIEADLDHAASADGTEVDAVAGQDGIAFAIVSRFDRRRGCRRLESGADERELGGPAGVRQESEVADAAEAHQLPTAMGPVTTAVFDDTCGNLIQIAQRH